MADDFCAEHSAHARAIRAHDERLDSHSRQLDSQLEGLHAMELALQKLTDIEQQNQVLINQNAAKLADIGERVDALEDAPARDAKRLRDAAVGAIGGAIGTGIVGGIAVAISNAI